MKDPHETEGAAPTERPLRALTNPLPAGVRDLLPEETAERRSLSRGVLEHFALAGYDLVVPPAFEFAEVLERGLGTLDPGDVLRFIEPETGEVAALRPDMTPQLARMVATRLARRPRPIRLCYEGTVLRRKQGRARRSRQIPQAGIELYGVPGFEGDLEVLELAWDGLRRSGLSAMVVDLGHARIASALLEPLPEPLALEIAAALEQKDAALVERLVATAPDGVSTAVRDALAALPGLHAGASASALFPQARALFAGTGAEVPLAELERVFHAASEFAEVRVDLGEVRGFAYYTGILFHILAEGPGEPLAAGGRYDNLLARFDAPMPAVGSALHLDAVLWARRAAGVRDPRPKRVLVVGSAHGSEVVRALRSERVAAAPYDGDDPLGFARIWGYSHLARTGPRALELVDVSDGHVVAEGSDASVFAPAAARVVRGAPAAPEMEDTWRRS